MILLQGYDHIDEHFANSIVTIGNFDGVHRGHRDIIESVVARARKERGVSVVYTFRPHPNLALRPSAELQLLNTYEEKADLIQALGVDVLIEQPFSREFSTISADRFFRDVLLKRLSAKAIYVGYDFGFGKNREGNLEKLSSFCESEGVELKVAKPYKVDGEVCSSSRIRHHILEGQIQRANALLGRPFFYRGIVVKGNGRGRTLGFATANVKTEGKFKVKNGVYATRLVCRGRNYNGVTNIGRQPTFNKEADSPIVVESHLFSFNEEIYGEQLEVQIIDRIRDEVRFPSVDALVAQIKLDASAAAKILNV